MSLCDPYEVESALPLGHGAGSRKVRFAPKHSHEGAAAMIEVEWWEYDDAAEMAEAVAGDIGFIIESALDARGQALIALPGGKSPVPIFEKLAAAKVRSEEHTSELQSLMRNSNAVFGLKKKSSGSYADSSLNRT